MITLVRKSVLACVAASSLLLSSLAAPSLDALGAAKIATDYLRTQGNSAPHITSLTLERSAFIGGKFSWFARWSKPIVREGRVEIGIQINLDGTYARIVEKPGKNSNRGNAYDIR